MVSRLNTYEHDVASIEKLPPKFDCHGRWSTPIPKIEPGFLAGEEVRATMHDLPRRYRDVLLLHDLASVGVQDISPSQDIGISEFKRLLHHARMALTTLLSAISSKKSRLLRLSTITGDLA